MSARGAHINCACCGRPGRRHGRGLVEACYTRHHSKGTLDRFPRVRVHVEPWQPTGPHGRRMLEQYRQFAAIRPRPTIQRIAFELGVTVRSVERYAAAVRQTVQARTGAAA